jgi:hypothetical protein
MTDTLPPLSTNEYALLQIMAQGESLADLGEYSRWSSPLAELVKRGFVQKLDKFNHVITEAGRAACSATEDDEMRALISVNNARIEARQTREIMTPLFSEPSTELLMAMQVVHAFWLTMQSFNISAEWDRRVMAVVDVAKKWADEGRFR